MFCDTALSPVTKSSRVRFTKFSTASQLAASILQVYMCGPQLYMDAAATIVGALGVPAAHLYQESFSF